MSSKPRAPSTHPKFLDMTIEAVTNVTDTKGASVPAIRNYITEKYKTVDPNALKFRLKQSLTKAVENGIIVTTKASAERPLMSGRFKLNKARLAAIEKEKAKKEKEKAKLAKEKEKKTETKAKKTETKAKKATGAKQSPKKVKVKVPVKSTSKSPKKSNKTGKTKNMKTPVKAAKPKTTKSKQLKTPKKIMKTSSGTVKK